MDYSIIIPTMDGVFSNDIRPDFRVTFGSGRFDSSYLRVKSYSGLWVGLFQVSILFLGGYFRVKLVSCWVKGYGMFCLLGFESLQLVCLVEF